MSAHGHDAPDESGTNRAWLSGVLIFSALVLAAGAGALNAQPHARTPAVAGPTGVVVLDDAQGTVLRGTVLVRGSTVAVIRGKAGEQVIPRSQVRYFNTENSELGADYQAKFPASTYKTHDPRPSLADASGVHCVVLDSGAVLVGTLRAAPSGLTVTQAGGVSTTVPRGAIRWQGEGETPSAAYWKQFGDLPIDSRFARAKTLRVGPAKTMRTASNEAYGEAAKRNPKISMAILAQRGSDWGPATGLWLQVYKAEAYKRTYFENAKICSRNWIGLHLDPFRRDALEKAFETLFEITKTHDLFDRPEIKALLAVRLKEAAESTYTAGFPKTAHGLVGRMATLGGDYESEAELLWVKITGQ